MRRKLETSGEVVRVEFPALNVGTSAFPLQPRETFLRNSCQNSVWQKKIKRLVTGLANAKSPSSNTSGTEMVRHSGFCLFLRHSGAMGEPQAANVR